MKYNLDYDFHTEVSVTKSKTKGVADEEFDIRSIINAYKVENGKETRELVESFVITESMEQFYDRTVELNLKPGYYQLLIWSDYVTKGSGNDRFFDTSDFTEIKIANSPEAHPGNEEHREAFRGIVNIRVDNSDQAEQDEVNMERPLGKFTFIATDLDLFIYHVEELATKRAKSKGDAAATIKEATDDTVTKVDDGGTKTPDYSNETKTVNPDDYKVIIRYGGFMPSSFNMFTNKPNNSVVGASFEGKMKIISDTEAELGFDHIFVNGSESKVNVSLEVYDLEGNIVSNIESVEVPVVRSKHTIVRGSILTSLATGGVGISPGFAGDFNLEIK